MNFVSLRELLLLNTKWALLFIVVVVASTLNGCTTTQVKEEQTTKVEQTHVTQDSEQSSVQQIDQCEIDQCDLCRLLGYTRCFGFFALPHFVNDLWSSCFETEEIIHEPKTPGRVRSVRAWSCVWLLPRIAIIPAYWTLPICYGLAADILRVHRGRFYVSA